MLDIKQQQKWVLVAILLFMLLLFANGCQRVVAELPISYPGETIENCDTILIPVRIGSKRYMFFVDTGASITTLDLDLKPLLGEFLGVRNPVYSFDNIPLDLYKIKTPIKIGHVEITGVVACSDINKNIPDCGVDGILGQDVMDKFVVQIDNQNKLLKLLTKSPPNLSFRKDWGTLVPIIRDSDGFICIKMNLKNGLYEKFMVQLQNSWLKVNKK